MQCDKCHRLKDPCCRRVMSASSDAAPTIGEIDVGTLHSMLNEAGNALENVQLVDVREEHEESIASLPGFQLMPLSRYHIPNFAGILQLCRYPICHPHFS